MTALFGRAQFPLQSNTFARTPTLPLAAAAFPLLNARTCRQPNTYLPASLSPSLSLVPLVAAQTPQSAQRMERLWGRPLRTCLRGVTKPSYVCSTSPCPSCGGRPSTRGRPWCGKNRWTQRPSWCESDEGCPDKVEVVSFAEMTMTPWRLPFPNIAITHA